MAIISFSKDSIVDYIPEYGGNRDSDDPCVVRLRFVPYSKVQDYGRLISARLKGKPEGISAEVGREVQRKEFLDNVESISGYTVDGREVTAPGEFYDTADTALVIEIIQAMESAQKLTEGQRKN